MTESPDNSRYLNEAQRDIYDDFKLTKHPLVS